MAVAAMATDDGPIAWGSLQLLPLGGSVGRNVCLMVVSNGVVRLGVIG